LLREYLSFGYLSQVQQSIGQPNYLEMVAEKRFLDYFYKRLIVEIRHPGSLIHFQKAESIFNEYADFFDKVSVTNVANLDKTIELSKNSSFFTITSSWDRYVLSIENIEDFDDVKKLIQLYFVPINKRFGIKYFKRFGVRSIFLLPFVGEFEELVRICRQTFFGNEDSFNAFEQITDVGIWTMTGVDGGYKMNISVGPLKREEIKARSAFKNFEEKTNAALMVDIDLFVDTKQELGNVMSSIEKAYNSGRLKSVQFFQKTTQRADRV
jgi:hypothetical protein